MNNSGMVRHCAVLLVLSTIGLIAIGLMMQISTARWSSAGSKVELLDRMYLQLTWAVLGSGVCVLVARLFDYRWLQNLSWVILGIAVVLLVLCFVPPVGYEVNGSKRWISLQYFTGWDIRIQPSEFAKLACLIALAAWYARYHDRTRSFTHGLVIPSAIMAVPVGLILREIDLGCTVLILAAVLVVIYVAGVPVRLLMTAFLAALLCVAAVVVSSAERWQRIKTFVLEIMGASTESSPESWQQELSLEALAVGGWEGLGLGNSMEKLKSLPFADTDFIFPVIGQELGLQFTLLVVLAYVVFFLSGMCIAMHAPDRFGLFLGVGIVSIIVLQAMINIGVTTYVLPNKGLPLPFVSYGGSNMMSCLIGVGILLSIHSRTLQKKVSTPSHVKQLRITPPL